MFRSILQPTPCPHPRWTLFVLAVALAGVYLFGGLPLLAYAGRPPSRITGTVFATPFAPSSCEAGRSLSWAGDRPRSTLSRR